MFFHLLGGVYHAIGTPPSGKREAPAQEQELGKGYGEDDCIHSLLLLPTPPLLEKGISFLSFFPRKCLEYGRRRRRRRRRRRLSEPSSRKDRKWEANIGRRARESRMNGRQRRKAFNLQTYSPLSICKHIRHDRVYHRLYHCKLATLLRTKLCVCV